MYNLSYVISTRNKLDFLSVTLQFLIDNINANEEIIVIDGNSNDGTKEFLENLFKSNRIHQLISEPDYGESHGFNKGLLLAKGEFIKFITDDDCFNLPQIRICRDYMVQNKSIDLLIGNTLNVFMEDFSSLVAQESSKLGFELWKKNSNCFTFTGLSILMRKSSIPLLGIFNTSTKFPDTEFALRVTSLPIKLGWCNAPLVIRIDNYKSNLRNFSDKLKKEESDRIQYFYNSEYRKLHFFNLFKIKLIKIKSIIFSIKINQKSDQNVFQLNENIETFESFFDKCILYFQENKLDKSITSNIEEENIL
jgi:glycosyltransferase involved in cell wall biosynthesis